MKDKINFDGILAFFILAATIWVDYTIYTTNALPFKYRLAAMIVISIIAIIFILLTFKKLPNWATWTRRVFIVLFTILFAFSSFYLGKVGNFTKNLTTQSDSNVEKISVVVKSGSNIESLSDLKNKTVGYQSGLDASNGEYAKIQINKEVKKVKYVDDSNYTNLAEDLLNDKIDALIITNSYITSVTESLETFESSITSIHTFERSVKKTADTSGNSKLDLTKDNFTVLISGNDDKGDTSVNGRCDVVMLLLVSPSTNHIEMVSFPRDSYIPNLALSGGNDKLTHTGNNGVENTIASLENVIGFDIDFYIKVNFSSVVEVVDALGGISLDVKYDFTEQDSNRSFEANDLITLSAGVQDVNGEEALAYSRHRYDGVGDIGRTHAQQQVISSIIKKALTAEGATKVPTVLDILPNYMTTNISESQINSFVSYELDTLEPWTTSSSTLENGFSESLTTASMGSTLLSCYVLNENDIKSLYEKYYILNHPTTFNKFKFDLNDLSVETDYKTNTDITYTNSDLTEYAQGESVSEDVVEDTPTTPETPTTPTTPDVEYFTVTFVGKDGEFLTSQTVEKGKAATAPSTPDYGSEYVFTGWSGNGNIANITQNVTFTATYTYTPAGGSGE